MTLLRWAQVLLMCLAWGQLNSAWAAQPIDEPPAATEAPSRTRLPPLVWRLDIVAPSELKKLLGDYLDLARFQTEATKDKSLQISRSELRRLVASAPEQARELIEAAGYFSEQITTKVSEEVPGEPVVVTLSVEPGELAHVSDVQFVYEGDLDTKQSAKDAKAQNLVDAIADNWGLPVGDVFTQSAWASAKNAALARLRAEGYPTASWSGTAATVDATTKQVKLYLVADTGPTFYFGRIRIEGLRRQPASAIMNLAPFKEGDLYREKLLLDWQARIQKLNIFDRLFVTTDTDPKQAAASPVLVQVSELAMQSATLGVGVSSNTGPRVSAEYPHRNVLGLDWQSKIKIQWGSKDSNAQLDLTSLPWPQGQQGLISAQAAYVTDIANTVTTSQRLRIGQLRETKVLDRTDYIEFQRAKVRTQDLTVVSDASAVSGTTQWIFREIDNQILPTKGWTDMLQLSVGRSYWALNEMGYFGRAYTRATWYQPMPWNWFATARGEFGQVFARDAVSVPDTLMFRAGGDESVRGYAFRSLGVTSDGVIIGGRTLATASLELGHPLLSRLPSLWGALFVDAGDAASRFGQLQPKMGYGAGLRWRSPVGPLRLDFAYGAAVQQWRVHFSVGISL